MTDIDELDNENSLQKPRNKGKNIAKKNIPITTLSSTIFKDSEPEHEDNKDDYEVICVFQKRQPSTFH
ncbi:hypothetical protein DPMN_104275 [Dreissena polymorpha]|uniref:Uncharacterized protein n=1 Tax=Dreissena polymorpha TaxID=45954 RepID=A0A9D4H7G1_DREPO|nr:hypothetical protein DPMN_104275 [Dreissena polymorpha]